MSISWVILKNHGRLSSEGRFEISKATTPQLWLFIDHLRETSSLEDTSAACMEVAEAILAAELERLYDGNETL